MEIYASRLAEVELRAASPDEEDDEHRLIADYCQSLENTGIGPPPASPGQLMLVIDEEQRAELQAMIGELEAENVALLREYEQLRTGAAAARESRERSIGVMGGEPREQHDVLAEARLLR